MLEIFVGEVYRGRTTPEVAVASAATCDIGAVRSTRIEITGTATITSFGNSPNRRREVRFSGVLVLTHNVTSLILPTGGNILTAIGDVAAFVSDATGNWRCTRYQRASGAPLLPALLPPGSVIAVAANFVPEGCLACDGALYSRTVYPTLFSRLVRSSVATITIASPGVVTWPAHGLKANDPVKFTTSGALPTGLVAGTTYFVRATGLTADTFQLSTAEGGSAINTSGSQSGIHTAICAPFGDGDGSTTFPVPDLRGEFVRGWDGGRGVDANRSFGKAQGDLLRNHTHDYLFPSVLFQGTAAGNAINAGSGLPAASGNPNSSLGGAETRPRNVALMYVIKF